MSMSPLPIATPSRPPGDLPSRAILTALGRSRKFLQGLLSAGTLLAFLPDSHATSAQRRTGDFRDFYGICWNRDTHDNLLYARHMGHDYVMYSRDMEKDPLAENLFFYLETPQSDAFPVPRTVSFTKAYPPQEIALYEKYFARKDDSAFPRNLATGWFTTPDSFCVEPDFQKQEVIDYFVRRIVARAQALENQPRKFLCAGLAWDVPDLSGDFWNKGSKQGGRPQTLAAWTGGDVAFHRKGEAVEYPTYSDGRAAFYRQLFAETRRQFPGAKFIFEPYGIWSQWIRNIKDRPDAKEIMPDLLCQENGGTDFVTNQRIFDSGLVKGKEFVACSTPNVFGEKQNREIAALAAINGSWYNWYGRFGGTGDMPGYRKISEVPARLQLVRRVPAWDNLNEIPRAKRFWAGGVYSSPMSGMDGKVIWSTHPKSGKIFAVWLEPDGVVKLPSTAKVAAVHRTNGLFMETSNGRGDVEVAGATIRLTNREGLGKGYIISLRE